MTSPCCTMPPTRKWATTATAPGSMMQLDGAKDIGLEFHSLSKTYNMTGWRMGMVVGNADLIKALFQIKANLDSGIPQAIQEMSMAALTGSQDSIDDNIAIYQWRRDRVLQALTRMGLPTPAPRASLYVWAPAPAGFTSAEFAARLLEEIDIVVTPRFVLWAVRRRLHPAVADHAGRAGGDGLPAAGELDDTGAAWVSHPQTHTA